MILGNNLISISIERFYGTQDFPFSYLHSRNSEGNQFSHQNPYDSLSYTYQGEHRGRRQNYPPAIPMASLRHNSEYSESLPMASLRHNSEYSESLPRVEVLSRSPYGRSQGM